MSNPPIPDTASALSRILAQEIILRRKLSLHVQVIDPWYLEIDVLDPILTLLGVAAEDKHDPLSRSPYRERFYSVARVNIDCIDPDICEAEAGSFLIEVLMEERKKDSYGSRA